ncbi:MAG: integrase core domain-containing protein [Proteobacteria bacterium]|nr:integrase core domain-containing protein [Pseudomonadota bacterium]
MGGWGAGRRGELAGEDALIAGYGGSVAPARRGRQWRFFETLKVEKVKGESLKSLQETKEAIANRIAMQYNTKRLRSALDNISPCAFEEKPRKNEFSRPIVKAKVY